MSDQDVADALRSNESLVVVEAPAGCGKTFQGTAFVKDAAPGLRDGRVLVLTHTHAACSVFAKGTSGMAGKVEIRTIDALVSSVAGLYHEPLGLPKDLSMWGWRNGGSGFAEMAGKVAVLLARHPMVAAALANRYPVIVCDEHQDSSADQHAIVMALHRAGATLRVFGDPLQALHAGSTEAAMRQNWARWDALKSVGASVSLDYPHRWDAGSPALGQWVLAARSALLAQQPIDLRGAATPRELLVMSGNNRARSRTGYQLDRDEGRKVRAHVDGRPTVMVLGATNELVLSLRAFWGRQLPIWEGHTRNALSTLVSATEAGNGNPESLSAAVFDFVSAISTGFTPSAHKEILLREAREGCTRRTAGKPANLRAVAKCLVDDPTHVGVSRAISLIGQHIEQRAPGFGDVKVNHRSEFRDGTRLSEFKTPAAGFAELSRKRSYAHPTPPSKAISTIHKSKGLEFDHVVLVNCDAGSFGATSYGRCKLYVALSRARSSLALVLPTVPTPLFADGGGT